MAMLAKRVMGLFLFFGLLYVFLAICMCVVGAAVMVLLVYGDVVFDTAMLVMLVWGVVVFGAAVMVLLVYGDVVFDTAMLVMLVWGVVVFGAAVIASLGVCFLFWGCCVVFLVICMCVVGAAVITVCEYFFIINLWRVLFVMGVFYHLFLEDIVIWYGRVSYVGMGFYCCYYGRIDNLKAGCLVC